MVISQIIYNNLIPGVVDPWLKFTLIFPGLAEIDTIEKDDGHQYNSIRQIFDEGNRLLKIGCCQGEGNDWINV